MTQCVWRIATETQLYAADDFSGRGAADSGGRWNSTGVAMVYASSHISLAVLETIAHLNLGALPLNRFLIRIDIPDDVWERRTELTIPAAWNAHPAGISAISAGDQWVNGQSSAIGIVPSVIVPQEKNVLINPQHADARKLVANNTGRWTYDARLRK